MVLFPKNLRLVAWGMVGGALLAPLPAADVMAKADAQALIQRFLTCWQTGDAETFASLLHPDLVFGYPGGRFDRAGLLETFGAYQKEKKDIRVYFGDIFVSDGRKHIATYQFCATDRETGQRFAVGTGVVCTIRDGRIVLFKEFWDQEVAIQQKAGMLPLDEGVVAPWPASVWLRPETID